MILAVSHAELYLFLKHPNSLGTQKEGVNVTRELPDCSQAVLSRALP